MSHWRFHLNDIAESAFKIHYKKKVVKPFDGSIFVISSLKPITKVFLCMGDGSCRQDNLRAVNQKKGVGADGVRHRPRLPVYTRFCQLVAIG